MIFNTDEILKHSFMFLKMNSDEGTRMKTYITSYVKDIHQKTRTEAQPEFAFAHYCVYLMNKEGDQEKKQALKCILASFGDMLNNKIPELEEISNFIWRKLENEH